MEELKDSVLKMYRSIIIRLDDFLHRWSTVRLVYSVNKY